MALICLAAVVLSDVPPPHHPAPYHPPPHTPYKEPKRPYSYSYSVNDAYSGANFGAAESSDGNSVQVSTNQIES